MRCAVAEELHEVLVAGLSASRRLPPQDPRLTGHEGSMMLNAAYLVEIDDGARSRPRFEA